MSDSKVVVSKVKSYIKEKSGMNTSSAVFEILTKVIEKECDRAIASAKEHNRKTVMDRDFIIS